MPTEGWGTENKITDGLATQAMTINRYLNKNWNKRKGSTL